MRTKRNRKQRPAALRFGPAVKALLFCLFIGGSGLGYVWQKDQIYGLGEQIKRREQRLEELRRENHELGRHAAYLRSPRELDARVKKLNLGLGPVRPDQMLRLPEAPAGGVGEEAVAGDNPDAIR